MDKKKLFSIYEKLFQRKTIRYWKLHRKSCESKGFMSAVYLLRAKHIQQKLGGSFPVKPAIPYFHTPHSFSGIFISADAKMGENCTVYQQVVIGSNKIKESKGYGAPVIGNNVLIGAGVKIIGNVKIGDNVRIGANCCVTVDIPDNATVVMEKPRIIVKEKVNKD